MRHPSVGLLILLTAAGCAIVFCAVMAWRAA